MPTQASIQRVEKLVRIYTEKSGTMTHPDPGVTNAVVLGLARSLEVLGRSFAHAASIRTRRICCK